MTHYQTLQIDKRASDVVIKAAYRALSLRWHPDKNPGNKQCVAKMQQINNAYSILTDTAKRAVYDQTLIVIPKQAYTPPNQSHTTPRPTPKPQAKYEPEKESPPKGKEWGYGLHPNYKDKQPLKTSFSHFINNIPSGFVSFLKVLWSVIWPVTKILAKVTFWATFGLIMIVGLCLCSGGGSDNHYDNRYNRRY